MSDSALTAIGLASVIVLVIANGLFVATEFSYVAVRRTRVEQLAAQGHGRARLLLASLHDLDNYIAATQLGVTMSSLAHPSITRIAIANPKHAPYGRRAEEALRASGVWDKVEPKLVCQLI